MKKFLAVLLMLAMLLCGAAFAEDTAPALTKDVVVLFTTDQAGEFPLHLRELHLPR